MKRTVTIGLCLLLAGAAYAGARYTGEVRIIMSSPSLGSAEGSLVSTRESPDGEQLIESLPP